MKVFLLTLFCSIVLIITVFSNLKYFTIEKTIDQFDEKHCKCKKLKSNQIKSKIINGSQVDRDDLNWIASVYLKNDSIIIKGKIFQNYTRFFCTGSVITNNFIITASHCYKVYEKNIKLLSITYVGAGLDHQIKNILQSNDNFRKLKNYILNPNFNGNDKKSSQVYPYQMNDVALIELVKPFQVCHKNLFSFLI